MTTFSAVAGHQRLTTLLAQAIARGTLPPTLLFIGPSGVGKYRVAGAVAATLNCLEPVSARSDLPIDACGACRSCDRVTRGMHVDVISVEPDERASIKIDVVREVLTRTQYRPFEGRRRVVIVRDADTLEDAAQNSLLKSLEEPPSGTVFILTSAVPGLLLPTVHSRTMRLRFSRLGPSDVEAVLIRDHGLTPDNARTAAALADGSVGQALGWGSTDLAELREVAISLLQAGRSDAAQTRLRAAAVLAGKDRPREEVALVLRVVSSMLRDIELLNSGGDVRAMANQAYSKEIGALRSTFAGERAREAFVAVDHALQAVQSPRYAGVKVVSDWVATQV